MRPFLLSLMGLFFTFGVAAQSFPPIQLHPANNRYFLFRDKPTLLITSAEHYGAVLNLDFDYKIYLDELQRHALNYTRIFSGAYVEIPGAFNIAKNTLAPQPNRFLAPWRRSNVPGYFNGGNKFDLNQWDEEYFARLQDFVAEAGKRGIIVEMTLFSSMYGDNGWRVSPLHPKNNVNNLPDINRLQVQTLQNGAILRQQENMVRKIVQELNGFDNVIFEIQNEPWADAGLNAGPVDAGIAKPEDWHKRVDVASAASLAWQKHLAALIVAEEAGKPQKHLVVQNIANFRYQITNPNPNIAVFNFHYALPAAVALNLSLNKVIGFDESGFYGSADSTYRQQAWRFILAGGGLFNNLDYSFSTEKEDGTEVQSAPGGGSRALRAQLQILKNFMGGFDFLHMQPAANLLEAPAGSNAQALAIPGRQYAIYFNGYGPTRLNLDLPNGKYAVQWLNPETGAVLQKTNLKAVGGKTTLVSPPFKTDIALGIINKRKKGNK